MVATAWTIRRGRASWTSRDDRGHSFRSVRALACARAFSLNCWDRVMIRVLKFGVPLAVFVVIVCFLYTGLGRDPREIPSPLVGKPAPAFVLPKLQEEGTLGVADMKGKVWLLNVWASWCTACQIEHPLLVDLARQNVVPIVGLNYKDKPAEAKAWLAKLGDPYFVSVADRDGRVGIDYGVYGVPETFVIDGNGVIRYKQIGPITAESLRTKIIPLVKKLGESQGESLGPQGALTPQRAP